MRLGRNTVVAETISIGGVWQKTPARWCFGDLSAEHNHFSFRSLVKAACPVDYTCIVIILTFSHVVERFLFSMEPQKIERNREHSAVAEPRSARDACVRATYSSESIKNTSVWQKNEKSSQMRDKIWVPFGTDRAPVNTDSKHGGEDRDLH